MDIPTPVAIGLLVGLGVIIYFAVTCAQKEHYTRTTLSGIPNSRFVRTPVDYAAGFTEDLRADPHYIANPGDKAQPLEFGNIDFYPDLRRLNEGRLYEEYSNMYIGGTGKPFVPNDTKTRINLKELGDMALARQMDGAPYPGQTSTPLTEAMIANQRAASNPYRETIPITGGPGYFTDFPGSF